MAHIHCDLSYDLEDPSGLPVGKNEQSSQN